MAAYTTGCSIIFIYVRGEYFLAYERVKQAIKQAYEHGFLGQNVLGTDFSVELYLRVARERTSSAKRPPL